MPHNNLRILVVDNEYLIALDAECILRDAINCDVTITARAACSEKLRAERFDIVLLDIGDTTDGLVKEIEAALAAGSHLIFSATNDDFANGVPGFPDIRVLLKPYGEEALTSAIAGCVTLA